jgi:hypothetical protein
VCIEIIAAQIIHSKHYTEVAREFLDVIVADDADDAAKTQKVMTA